MKRILTSLFLFLFATIALAQSVALANPDITPSPLPTVEQNGEGVFSFLIVETSSSAVPVSAFGLPNVTISVDLSYVELTSADVSLITGTYSNYFEVTYDEVANILTFSQIAEIPGDGFASFEIPVTVTINSDDNERFNGFNANISAVDPTTNAEGNAASFTFTENSNTTDAVDDINVTYENEPVSGDVSTNDEDAEGNEQTVNTTPVTAPTNGTVVINADGSYTYTPNEDFVGEDSFEYSVCDNGDPEACDTATVYIEVLETPSEDNEAPVANVDTSTTEVGEPVEITVLGNDFDPDGDTITVTPGSVTDPENGTAVLNPDGTIIYTPDEDFVGEDTFEYTICDNGDPVLCDTATVVVTVDAENPENTTVANDDASNGDVDTVLTGNVLDNDTDPEDNEQTVNTTPVTGPENGTLVLNSDGSYEYTPNEDFTGTDSFVYSVCDDGEPEACDTATVILTVNPEPNTTDAVDDINVTYENEPVSGDVSTNDEDAEGNEQTVNTTPVTAPTNGTVVINSDGSYTYTPNEDFVGEDSFEYSVCDDGDPEACDTATVYIEVLETPSEDNEAPIANTDTATTEEESPVAIVVTSNDFDPDGDTITVTPGSVTDPENGTAVLNPDGTITYTPDEDFVGEDTFEYTICDNGDPVLCDTATVVVTVDAENPENTTVANDDASNGDVDTVLTGNVLDNDTDPEDNEQTVNTTPVTGPENGTLVLNSDGSYEYTPNEDFTGTDSFVYSVCDDGEPEACDTATVILTVNPEPNTTEAVDDINVTYENEPVSGDVSTNDEDAEGNEQTVNTTPVTAPTNGTVVINSDGSYTYTPNEDFVGEDSFEYSVCDDGDPEACDTATVYIEVLETPSEDNEAPIANTDTATTEEESPVAIVVTSNDFDPDGDTITVTPGSVTDPENGTAVLNPDGTITYTPDEDFVGEDTFEYTICDNGDPVLCDTATVVVTVDAENPENTTVANDDASNGDVDTVLTGNVLDNDTDPEDNEQTVNTTPVTGPENGTLVLNSDGSYEYTPNEDFTGTDSFVYSVCDDGEPEACDTATVILTVNPEPNTTEAVDDINVTYENEPVSGDVSTNDEDAEGNEQTVNTTPVTAPTNGTVVINSDGSYTYTPNEDFVGEDSFEYSVCDDGDPEACDTATVYIEVLETPSEDNEAPIANTDTATTEEGSPVAIVVTSNDFDPDGDTITVTPGSVTDPENGTAVLNPDGTITYTPDEDFVGEDTFEYTICDNGDPVLCDTATVVVTVDAENPENTTVANDDASNGDVDTVLTGNVLDNDTDPEDNEQTVNTTPVTGPENGTLVLNSDGSYEYTPNEDFTGTDSFVYSVCDDGEPEACDTATVILTVNPEPNTTEAVDDINVTYENEPVSGDVSTNDEDAEGNEQTVNTTPVTAPTNGTVVINSDGSYTYTPNEDFVGEDSFEYSVCDNGDPEACDTATVYIEVLETPSEDNEAPIANTDTATTEEGSPVAIVVISNDFDPDDDTITVTPGSVTDPENGTAVLNPDGTITYTPDEDFVGEDTFEYTICDNGDPVLCDTATVVVTVDEENPENTTVANDDASNGDVNMDVSGNVLDNDTDPEGNEQTVNTTPVTGSENGTLVLNSDGTYVYTPNENFAGTDSFVYSVCDDGEPEACDTATVVITINPDPNTTEAVDDINNTFVNVSVEGNVLTNDEDAEGNAQTVNTTPVTEPTNGTVVLNADGSYTYTPNEDYVGEDSFEYTVCDDGIPQVCDTAIVYIEVLAIPSEDNEAPIANVDTSTTEVGEPVEITVLGNDFDPDGDTITVTPGSVTDPENGTAVLNPDGTITYTPNEDFVGEDTFEYTICDNGDPVLCDTATVVVTVDEENPENTTVANDDASNGDVNMDVLGNVLDNDTDPEGNEQTVNTTPVTGPENGTLVLNSDGTYVYTPNEDFAGTDSFVYSVCDDGEPEACDTATVVITINPGPNTTEAVDDINNTFVNVSVEGNVLTNDEDAEGNAQTVNTTPVTEPTNGTVVLNADGSYTYTPNEDYVGEDSFEYTVCDDGIPQVCDTAIVYIEVLAIPSEDNEAPIANVDTSTTEVGEPVEITVLGNDFDPDGDTITVTPGSVTDPENGTAVLNPDGTITYTPNEDFVGEDTFEYTICDNGDPVLCDTATVVVTVDEENPENTTVANDDASNGDVNMDVLGNVLDNDTDPEGNEQTVNTTPVTGPENGTLVLNSDGTYVYTPNEDFAGTDSFVYSVCDDGEPEACDTATVVITINPGPNTTEAVDDINNTFVNVSVEGNVLTNDEDTEGNAQTVNTTPVTGPENGTVVVNSDGTYEYTPNEDFVGEDSFEYSVCDDGIPQACDTAIVYIEVLAIPSEDNEAPVANVDTSTTEVGEPVEITVLGNDFDPDGDTITVTPGSVTDPENGTAVLNPDGTITYTPDEDFVGEDTFEYTICDNGDPVLCDTATVVVTVDEENPENTTVANDDASNGDINMDVSGNVLDNDTDPEGNEQTVNTTPVTGPENGTVVLNSDGTYVYTPNEDFAGTDSFVYSVCDDGEPEACDTATVVITINPGPNTTEAVDDFNNTFVNVSVEGNVLTNDEDAEGNAQTVNTTPVTGPENGTVVVNSDGTYEYTPNEDFVGEDSFEYSVCDDGIPQACDTAIVYIEVLAIPSEDNEAPIANVDTSTTEVGEPVEITVLGNDFDPDGDTITVTPGSLSTPSNGTVVLNSDGTITYTPNAGFVGEDTFTYEICDNGNPVLCDTTTIIVTVEEENLDNTTEANDDAYNGDIDTNITGSVLDNDTDIEGDTQTVNPILVENPSNGTVVMNADGTFTYTPNEGFTGTDSFVYNVCDDGNPVACDEATVIITVNPEDVAENTTEAVDDINNTFVNVSVEGNVLTNDEDAEGNAQTVNTTPVTGPTNGTVVVNSDGTYEYTPNEDFVGEDSFEYSVCDDGIPQACDTAIVYIEVLAIPSEDNEAPVANVDTSTTEVGEPVEITVLGNDFDPDGDTITVTPGSVTDPENGTAVLNSDGTITYTPDEDFVGEDTFEYTICDNGDPVLCDTATVVVTVDEENPENTTVANDDASNGDVDTVLTGNVLDNDTDPEDNEQTVNTTPVTGPENGTLVLNSDGSYEYTPNEDFTGTDSFVYSVCDDGEPEACDTATVILTVNPEPNTTDAVDDINVTYENEPVSGDVSTNDEDAEGNAQTVNTTPVTEPTNGTVVLNADGSYTYTPNDDFVGTDSFIYSVCDDGEPVACDEAAVYIEVLGTPTEGNEPPIANVDTSTTEVGEPVEITVLGNDFDPDGDTITVTPGSLSTPSNGTVVLNSDGTITYTPNAGFVGEDTFTYEICDNGNPVLCDTTTVIVTVEEENLDNTTEANDDAYNGDIDTNITGSVLDNDTDIEGDTQTVNPILVENPLNGTVVMNVDGTFTYTPNAGFTGTDSFVYNVCDDGNPVACDEATVIITVNPEDVAENTTEAIDDINNTFVNVSVSGNVLTNDEDAEGNEQTVNTTPVTEPTNGTVVLNSDGSYTYTPNDDFVGTDSFIYSVCDDGEPVACDEATVYIEVLGTPTEGNEPPIANVDTSTTEVGEPVEITVLGNDFDPDGDTITVTPGSLSTPSNGTVVLNSDGTITYTPNAGFVGEDTFTYEICDNGNPVLCDTTTVIVTVEEENLDNTTEANDDAYNGDIDTNITGSVLDNDTDIEGDTQTVNPILVENPLNGTVVMNVDGTFTYTPNAGFTGTDSFVYNVCDDGNPVACDEATVIITVNPEDVAENTTEAIDDINNTFVNVSVSGNVLTNDEDAEGNEQTVNTTPVTEPTNGTVVLNSDGSYTYTPNDDFVGTDSFIYSVCDDGEPVACDEATVYIEVLGTPTEGNEPPIANVDTSTTEVGEPVEITVLGNDFDPDGDTITVTPGSLSTPSNGTVVLNSDGTITYTPNAGFVGEDTFTYEICDNGNPVLCDTTTVIVTVEEENLDNTTEANDDAYNGDIDTNITGSVLDNDTDIEGDTQTVNPILVENPLNGTVVMNVDGTFTYTPNAGFTGTDSFVYNVCDDGNPVACDEATVYITINGDSGVLIDTDGDQIPDVTDIDDDNDGILDIDEGDGSIDTDGDMIPDSLDLDSDNDTIPDNVEGQSTDGYIPPTGNDTDGDGLDDAYDPDNAGTPVTIPDTDDDNIPDYLDLDSDGDGLADIIEAGNGDHDTDGDGATDNPVGENGLDNGVDPTDGYDPDAINGTDVSTDPATELPNWDDDAEPDYRDIDFVDIGIDKVHDDSDNIGTIDEEIVFTISVTNFGTVVGTNVIISEVLPEGYEYLDHFVNSGDSGGFNEITGVWIIDSIEAGQTVTLELTALVLGTFDYLNTASLESLDQLDSNSSNDTDSAGLDGAVEPAEDCVIYNEFSPNGDGVNDFFEIECIDEYPNNTLEIYNRWGNIVYKQNAYKNDWDGTSNGRSTVNKSEKLPVGTYYYVLDYGDGVTEKRAGWLYINR